MMPSPEISAGKKTSTDQPVLIIRHLYKSFGKNDVLINFNLQLEKGQSVAVLGRSGSGKSVLIKCIVGLMEADEGSIEILNQDIATLHNEELDKLRSRVGFLFQSNALYDSMTVRENLEFPLRRHWMQVTQDEVNSRVMQALDDVGLSHTLNMMPAELSGGMKKRIALARTLILTPEIILYDEPTTGLDPITGKEIIGLMVDIHNKYKTASLVITHDMNCVKMASDRVVILLDGKCYAFDTYEQLKLSSDPRIKQFFQ